MPEQKDVQKAKLEFLRDDPISDSETDEFKHSSISETLKGIINDTKTPLTIGLFADWGVGKSSVSTILKKALMSQDNIACVEFDVWKYEDEESLRRQFLYTLDKQLRDQKKRGKGKLSERLDASIARDVNDGLELDLAAIAKAAILLFIVVATGILADSKIIFSLTTLASIIAIVGLGTFLKSGLAIIKNKKKTMTETRLTTSDEFEKEFHDMVDASTAEKIIVILDNLDRATEEKAVMLLSTVKSFLEYKKCVYLVPCDEGAIKKHLRHTYNYLDDDAEVTADEFLRKFFNTYIRIPNFIDADLQVYTEKHLRQTKFDKIYPNIENLATVITSAYRANPRQIKQFINIFIAHFLLAQKRETDGDMPQGEVTSNPEFLAKVLVIQQKWPAQYQNILGGATLADAAGSEDYRIFLTGSSLTEEPLNIRSFLYYKRSKTALNLPAGAAEDLQTAMEDAKLDDVKMFIDKIQQGTNDFTKQLNVFFRTILDDAVHGNRHQIIVNVIKSLDAIWVTNKLILDKLLLQRAMKAIKDKLPPDSLFAINEAFVTHSLAAESTKTTEEAIATKYLSSLNQMALGNAARSENIVRSLCFIEDNQQLFIPKSNLDKLNQFLKSYAHDKQVINKIISSKELLRLIQSSFINEVISKIKAPEFGSSPLFGLASALIIKSPNSDTALINQYMESVRMILGQGQQFLERKEYLDELMNPFLDVLAEKQDLIIQNDYSRTMIDSLINTYRNIPVFEHRSLALKPLLALRHFANDAQKSDIQALLNEHTKVTAQAAEDLLTDPHFENLFNDIRHPLEDAAVNNGAFINVIWKFGDEDSKISLIDRLFTVSSNTALALLEEKAGESDLPKDLERIAHVILRQSDQANVIERDKFYEVLVKVNPHLSKATKDEVAKRIVNIAKQADLAQQEQAERLLAMFRRQLSKKALKSIGSEILDWLDSQPRINSNFLPSIRLAIANHFRMTKEDIKKLFKITLDLWALQEQDQHQIELVSQLNLSGPEGLRNEYYQKIDDRINALPQMTDSLVRLKESLS